MTKLSHLTEEERKLWDRFLSMGRTRIMPGDADWIVGYIPILLSTINALRERVEAAEGWVGWSESSPKVGQLILLCCGELGCVPRVARWTEKGWVWTDSESPYDINGPATHWRPLPPSPKAEEQSKHYMKPRAVRRDRAEE